MVGKEMNHYRLLENTKDEINSFINYLNLEANMNISEKDESDYRFISKNLLFLKSLYEYQDNETYLNLLIYSTFQMLYNSIIINEGIEKFNLYKRIYIENLFRYLLSVEDTRESIRDMKDRLKENKGEEEKRIIEFFYSEHRKSSGILHINDINDINVSEYFRGIININSNCVEEIKFRNIKEIYRLLDKGTDLLIMEKANLIGETFYNRMEVLEYLLGKKKYKKYQEIINFEAVTV